MSADLPSTVLPGIKLVLLVAIHITFAVYILQDATRRDRLLFDTPPWLWALVVLFAGLIGAAVYWLANCARFVRSQTLWSDTDGG